MADVAMMVGAIAGGAIAEQGIGEAEIGVMRGGRVGVICEKDGLSIGSGNGIGVSCRDCGVKECGVGICTGERGRYGTN